MHGIQWETQKQKEVGGEQTEQTRDRLSGRTRIESSLYGRINEVQTLLETVPEERLEWIHKTGLSEFQNNRLGLPNGGCKGRGSARSW